MSFKRIELSMDFTKGFLKNRSFLKKAHYPYRAVENDPFAKYKTEVFHIMRLFYSRQPELSS